MMMYVLRKDKTLVGSTMIILISQYNKMILNSRIYYTLQMPYVAY